MEIETKLVKILYDGFSPQGNIEIVWEKHMQVIFDSVLNRFDSGSLSGIFPP